MQYQHTDATLAIMKRSPVIPVMQVADAADALAQTKTLVAGGLSVLEITLRTSAALKSIEMLVRAFPEAVIGAGTITDEDQMQAAIDAGAAFLVSPGHDAPPAAARTALAGAVSARRRHGDGSHDALRARFPLPEILSRRAGRRGEISLLLGGPLPDLVFCPTGGIDPEKAKGYLELRNVACVGGSWMVAPSLSRRAITRRSNGSRARRASWGFQPINPE